MDIHSSTGADRMKRVKNFFTSRVVKQKEQAAWWAFGIYVLRNTQNLTGHIIQQPAVVNLALSKGLD